QPDDGLCHGRGGARVRGLPARLGPDELRGGRRPGFAGPRLLRPARGPPGVAAGTTQPLAAPQRLVHLAEDAGGLLRSSRTAFLSTIGPVAAERTGRSRTAFPLLLALFALRLPDAPGVRRVRGRTVAARRLACLASPRLPAALRTGSDRRP